MDLQLNPAMISDFYEFTMANGYYKNGCEDQTAYFDMSFRRIPDNGGFAIMAGVEQLIHYLKNWRFNDDDIEYLRAENLFDEQFLRLLKNLHFSCDVWTIPEGTPVFPNEPIVIVRGPILQAQLIETMVLLIINHQSLIATKANRLARAAGRRGVAEFGSRRAQGTDGAVLGARAAYIGGCIGTACTAAGKAYGIPVVGTMAHSWVQMFSSELCSFREYVRVYPENCTLLVDTYNVLKSGVPNAIRVFQEELVPRGIRPKGIRIDSGDITYLSRKARIMLDEAGFPDCKIVASNSLDEFIIDDLMTQGAQVDIFGVGERLITAKSDPVFGGVYKLAAIENDGQIIPKIKLSENVEKITIPGFKQVWRLFDHEEDKAIADVITHADETIDCSQPYEIFHPEFSWKRKKVTNFYAQPLLTKIFDKGQCVYDSPGIKEIRDYREKQVNKLWDEVLRFENPHTYYVDLSKSLCELKEKMLLEYSV